MQPQGHLGIERLYTLADVSRGGDYRHWRASAPRREETALRDAIQILSLENRHRGYRMVTALLKPAGWAVNRKRVERLRREVMFSGQAIPGTLMFAISSSRHRKYLPVLQAV